MSAAGEYHLSPGFMPFLLRLNLLFGLTLAEQTKVRDLYERHKPFASLGRSRYRNSFSTFELREIPQRQPPLATIPSPTSPYARFLDLPNEVLMLIISELSMLDGDGNGNELTSFDEMLTYFDPFCAPHRDLCALGFSSRRLRDLVLSGHLAGLKTPDVRFKSAFVPREWYEAETSGLMYLHPPSVARRCVRWFERPVYTSVAQGEGAGTGGSSVWPFPGVTRRTKLAHNLVFDVQAPLKLTESPNVTSHPKFVPELEEGEPWDSGWTTPRTSTPDGATVSTHVDDLLVALHFPLEDLLWETLALSSMLEPVVKIDSGAVRLHGLYVLDPLESSEVSLEALEGELGYRDVLAYKWVQLVISHVFNQMIYGKHCEELLIEIPDTSRPQNLNKMMYFCDLRTSAALEQVLKWKCAGTLPSIWQARIPSNHDNHSARSYPLRSLRINQTDSPVHNYVNLRTLSLSAPILFQKPFLTWLIDLVNTTPTLTELRLLALNLIHPTWATFLYHARIQNLRTLMLDGCNVPFVHLMTFLSKHPLLNTLVIESLDIGEDPVVPPPPSFKKKLGGLFGNVLQFNSKGHSYKAEVPKTLLPALTTLVAPLHYVVCLLTPKTSCRALASLTIITSAVIGSDFRREEHILKPISERLHALAPLPRLSPASSSSCTEPSNGPNSPTCPLSLKSSGLSLRVYMLRPYEGDPPFGLVPVHPDPGSFLQEYPFAHVELVGALLHPFPETYPAFFLFNAQDGDYPYPHDSNPFPRGYYYGNHHHYHHHHHHHHHQYSHSDYSPDQLPLPMNAAIAWLKNMKKTRSLVINEFGKAGIAYGMLAALAESFVKKIAVRCPWIERVYLEVQSV